MNAHTVIPKGYRLTVTSWENDGDNSRTVSEAGLSLPRVKLMVELCQLLKSGSNSKHHFGNMYEPDKKEKIAFAQAMKAIIRKHPKEAGPDWLFDLLDDDDLEFIGYARDIYHELFGSSEYYYTRVYDSHIVERIPEPIEIEDVTRTLYSIVE